MGRHVSLKHQHPSDAASISSSDQGNLEADEKAFNEELAQEVIDQTREILRNAADCTLKAVELANTVRGRLGTQVLTILVSSPRLRLSPATLGC